MIKILVVDDHQLVRAGLKRMLEEQKDFQIVGEASNGKDALEAIDRLQPDVILLDIAMPEMDGMETMSALVKQRSRPPKVVMLTMHDDEHYAARLLRMGAGGYVTKDTAPAELVNAIRTVYAGNRFISSSLRDSMAIRFVEGGVRDPLEACSNREFQVLRHLASGRTNREIAAELGVSVKTIDAHRLNLLAKLGIRNNAELTRFAIQHSIVKS